MLRLALAGLCALTSPTDPPCRTQSDAATAFVDVTVIPMDRERRLQGQTVVVRGDRIVALGPSARVKVPQGATRVEGKGRFLIPGLAEMHAHIPGGQASDSAVERTLFLYLAGGLTTIRGMLGHPRHLVLRERAAHGELLSPTIYAAGPSLNGNSVPDPAAARKAVLEQKEAGYDLLKIHPGIGREAFDTLVATARRVGIPFAGHVPQDVGIAHAIEAGYATVEHLDGYVEAMVREGAPVSAEQSAFFGLNLGEHLDGSKLPALVAATKRAGVWNVPTEVLLENLVLVGSSAELAQRPEMRYVPSEMLAEWAQVKDGMLAETGSSPESARRTIEVRRRLIKALHTAGAGLLLGSDAPQVYNVPGFSTHRELESLVAAGLTPYQALETGTRNVARYLGTERETGTVAQGKRADLILPIRWWISGTRRSGRG
ncbi:MAG TPA: amidohydrolase family protein [Gemmatimonadales bacterium]